MASRLAVACLAILLASFVCTVAMPLGRATPLSVKVYVDPPSIINDAMVPNTVFNISVKIDNIPATPGLAGVEFNLTWDSSVLNVVSMQEIIYHEVTPEAELDNLWKIKHVVTNGSVLYAYTWQDIDRAVTGGYAPISGNHVIANVTLKVKGTGKTALHLVYAKLGDPQANPIAHDNVDGFFDNLPAVQAPEPALYVDPQKVVDANLTSGSNFTINVNMANASGVAGLEFKLGFNASALQASSVTRGSFIPVSVTPITQIDNTTGFVLFNATLSVPLDGNGTLAVIQFQVLANNQRNSTLHLYDVKLIDNSGQTPTTLDGSFTNARTILGDLNGDGIVDINDAIVLSHAFGSLPGDPDWNPDGNFSPFPDPTTGEQTIDIFDLILLAANFGHTL